MKQIKIAIALAAMAVFAGCRKEEPRPEQTDLTPKRDNISYNLTIVPRAERTTGDTIWLKVNGNLVLNIKGNITPTYYTSNQLINGLVIPKVKTGDKLELYYHPGVVTLGNGNIVLDENGLAVYMDYNTSNNTLVKEFNCRCTGNWYYEVP
jgi:hypothetical protein